MGTFEKGILGGFKGKVGAVIGSTWKGTQVMRSKPGKRKKPASALQLDQQARFALMTDFLQPLSAMLNETFSRAVGMSGYNKALSYNIQQAVSGDYPDLSVNYAAVLLSKGSLPGAQSPAVASPAAGKLACSWTDNSNLYKAASADQALLIVYCGALKQWVVSQGAATRNAGSCTVDVAPFSGQTVQTWFSFIAENGRAVARSLFTGAVNVL
ncbi:MAG: DUF6266 family protein [Chitinophaga rupis]|jgi:hypothetical protein